MMLLSFGPANIVVMIPISLPIALLLFSTVQSTPLHSRGNTMVSNLPRFVTRGQNYRVVIGDTLVLPCEVENLDIVLKQTLRIWIKTGPVPELPISQYFRFNPAGFIRYEIVGILRFPTVRAYVLLWRRGSSVLTADKLMVTRDSRLRLIDGYNLEIANLMPQDAGDYVCQIGDGDNKDQIHTVEILVPPSIRTSPASGQLTARKGGTITLECKASGNPVPSILWSRKDNALPSGEKAREGFSITLEKVDRHQAGVYQCTANNGVGEPVTVDMQLDVLYPPEIEVERSWVHSGEGYEAQLVCVVHGEPAPNIMWYQDSFMLDPTERRTMENRGNKHTLTLKHVQASDFGNYSCVAENSLGKSKKYMELSGRPSPAQFRSAPFSRARDTYNLTWIVESYPPLEEVRLLYRKIMMNDTHQRHGKWHEVILHPPHGDTFSHLMFYNIRGLDSSSVYEAIAQAKNRYGWNEVSDLYQFYTRGSDYPSEPSLEDMELVAAGGRKAVASTLMLILTSLLFAAL